jgi:two-component system, LytTR family, response regulator
MGLPDLKKAGAFLYTRIRLGIPNPRFASPNGSSRCSGKVRQATYRRFPVRVGSRIQLVFTEDIEWIAGAGNYAELHTQGRCHLLRETLNSLEQKLDPSQFLRIHRSRIVRARCVRELQPIDNREYLVKLSDGSEHRSSRTYADRLDDWLSSRRP